MTIKLFPEKKTPQDIDYRSSVAFPRGKISLAMNEPLIWFQNSSDQYPEAIEFVWLMQGAQSIRSLRHVLKFSTQTIPESIV